MTSQKPGRLSDPVNTNPPRFVEFETANDLKTAIEKLDGRDFKGSRVSCVADVRTKLRLRSWDEVLILKSFRSSLLTSAPSVILTGLGPLAGAIHP